MKTQKKIYAGEPFYTLEVKCIHHGVTQGNVNSINVIDASDDHWTAAMGLYDFSDDYYHPNNLVHLMQKRWYVTRAGSRTKHLEVIQVASTTVFIAERRKSNTVWKI